MKGFPWYAHHLEDYDRRTGHLSMLEHGAYRLLLDNYYRTGAPLPKKIEHLHRICRAFAKEERQAVESVIKEYFHLGPDGWRNSRADEEMEKAREISGKRRAAAKKSHKQTASNSHAIADTPTTTPTEEESKKGKILNFVVGKNGNGNGHTTIKDPQERLHRFEKKLAESFPHNGWDLVIAAQDRAHPQHLIALEACKKQAAKLQKGWPRQWPV
jgi:uncharacterized protein YdaU (DUF1376 family)